MTDGIGTTAYTYRPVGQLGAGAVGTVDSKVPPVEGAVKLPGDQEWRDPQGNIWKKDKLHKDHWDVTDRAGEKIKEVDFSGRQIWPGGPKNMNKK